VPDEASWTPVDGQINEFYLWSILHAGDGSALGATLDGPKALHVDAKATLGQILHAENIYIGKSDKARINGARVGDHGGSFHLVGLRTPTGWQSSRLFLGMRSSARHFN
jgi:hypothetical protein